MTFEQALAEYRAQRIPVMALRPCKDAAEVTFGTEMDDIVVESPTMFRAEAMSEDSWWLACYFANGQRVTFQLSARCRPRSLSFTVGELPDDWRDWDKLRGHDRP